MKTVQVISAGLASVLLITAFTFTNHPLRSEKAPSEEPEYIILNYDTYATNSKAFMNIYYGGTKHERIQLTKEQIDIGIGNTVVDQLTKFESQGYTLVSTTTVDPNQINCFLKKQRK